MTTYLFAVFIALSAPPILLFAASEISYQHYGRRLRYPVLAILWLCCVVGYVYVGYVQVSAGCSTLLGYCYTDGVTISLALWKDLLAFTYSSVFLVSSVHLLYQASRWALATLLGRRT